MAGKLSPAQLRVVNRMREGWVVECFLDESIWLVKDGIREKVNPETYKALYSNGLIQWTRTVHVYALTEKGATSEGDH